MSVVDHGRAIVHPALCRRRADFVSADEVIGIEAHTVAEMQQFRTQPDIGTRHIDYRDALSKACVRFELAL